MYLVLRYNNENSPSSLSSKIYLGFVDVIYVCVYVQTELGLCTWTMLVG